MDNFPKPLHQLTEADFQDALAAPRPSKVFVEYRMHGAMVSQWVPSAVAHRIAETAVQCGADYHVIQGTWDPRLRRHVPPDSLHDLDGFDVELEPRYPEQDLLS